MALAPQKPIDDQARRRRRNSVALAVILGFLAALFYVLTIAKMGPGIFNRDL